MKQACGDDHPDSSLPIMTLFNLKCIVNAIWIDFNKYDWYNMVIIKTTALAHFGNGKMTSLTYGLAWLKDLPILPLNSYCRGNVTSRLDSGPAFRDVDGCCNHIIMRWSCYENMHTCMSRLLLYTLVFVASKAVHKIHNGNQCTCIFYAGRLTLDSYFVDFDWCCDHSLAISFAPNTFFFCNSNAVLHFILLKHQTMSFVYFICVRYRFLLFPTRCDHDHEKSPWIVERTSVT